MTTQLVRQLTFTLTTALHDRAQQDIMALREAYQSAHVMLKEANETMGEGRFKVASVLYNGAAAMLDTLDRDLRIVIDKWSDFSRRCLAGEIRNEDGSAPLECSYAGMIGLTA